MSKYEKLWKYVSKTNKESFLLSFSELEGILEFEIDHSFLTYKKELTGYGFEVKKIHMKDKSV